MWEAFGLRALPHAVYGGADFGECFTTVERVGNRGVDEWYTEWMATADRVANIAQACEAGGHLVSAREAYFRASSYYHVAYFPLFGKPVDPRLRRAFESETAVFLRAAAFCDPAVEAVEIPFEGRTLPGYFLRCSGDARPRPTLVHVNGYDSNIQEMYFAHGPAALRRGYHVLLLDGPGQGRNLIRDGVPFRPDWETVVRAAVDYALARPEVDGKRVVLAGWSFGGFLAPRAAAFEHRIAALIADPGQWDQADNLLAMGVPGEVLANIENIDPALFTPFEEKLRSADPMTQWRIRQRGFWAHGVNTLYELIREMVRFEITSVVQNIQCPTLVTQSEGDPVSRGAPKLYEALRCPKMLVAFTAAEGSGGHCEALARTLYHQRVFDWLDETLKA
jgi:pimeloyl-ACP methyl ester carboxylesterase